MNKKTMGILSGVLLLLVIVGAAFGLSREKEEGLTGTWEAEAQVIGQPEAQAVGGNRFILCLREDSTCTTKSIVGGAPAGQRELTYRLQEGEIQFGEDPDWTFLVELDGDQLTLTHTLTERKTVYQRA